MLEITVLLHDPTSAQLKLNRWPAEQITSISRCILLYGRVHRCLSDCRFHRSSGCKTCPNCQPHHHAWQLAWGVCGDTLYLGLVNHDTVHDDQRSPAWSFFKWSKNTRKCDWKMFFVAQLCPVTPQFQKVGTLCKTHVHDWIKGSGHFCKPLSVNTVQSKIHMNSEVQNATNRNPEVLISWNSISNNNGK